MLIRQLKSRLNIITFFKKINFVLNVKIEFRLYINVASFRKGVCNITIL